MTVMIPLPTSAPRGRRTVSIGGIGAAGFIGPNQKAREITVGHPTLVRPAVDCKREVGRWDGGVCSPVPPPQAAIKAGQGAAGADRSKCATSWSRRGAGASTEPSPSLTKELLRGCWI